MLIGKDWLDQCLDQRGGSDSPNLFERQAAKATSKALT
jgi:hypothetical protein